MQRKEKIFVFAATALIAFGVLVWGATHFEQVKASIGGAYFDFGGKRLYNVGLPQGSTEAATQGYVLSAGGTKYPYGMKGGGCYGGGYPAGTPYWPATDCASAHQSGAPTLPYACAAGWTLVNPGAAPYNSVNQGDCICTTTGGCATL